MKVGDLVTWANTAGKHLHKKRIGVVVETEIESWDEDDWQVVRVQWTDGHCFEYHVRDLEIIIEKNT